MVFGRAMRDFIPSLQYKYEPAKDWSVTQEYRERTLALKREADSEKWAQRTKNYEIIEVGTPVILQNQTGSNPNKWDKTGVVLENKPHSQVVIRVDGSRRVTTRNRRFVRKLVMDPKTLPAAPLVQESVCPPAQTPPTPSNYTTLPAENLTCPNQETCTTSLSKETTEQAQEAAVPNEQEHLDNEGVVPEDQPQHNQDEVETVVHDTEEPVQTNQPNQLVHDINPPRPKRKVKPNPKYSPDVYDLSYVGIKSRLRSRRSIRRTGT